MKRGFLLFLTVFCFATTAPIYAQVGRTLSFMEYNPYRNYINPAYDVQMDGALGLPVLSGLNLVFYYTGLLYKNLFQYNETGKTLTINNFIDNLKTNNYLNVSANPNLLFIAFRKDKVYVTIQDRLRFDTYLTYPQTLFKVLLQGNMNYIDQPAEFDNLSVSSTLYNEFSVGFRIQATDKLAIGFRPKLLTGLANAYTISTYFKLTTDPETYDITLQESFDANCSLPFDVNDVNMGDIPSNIFKNWGGAIDLGVEYKFDDHWSVAASACDLGFIKWKSNTMNFSSSIADGGSMYNNGSLVFSGIDVQQMLNDEEFFPKLVDSLKDYFPITTREIAGYNAMLKAKFTLSSSYHLNQNHAFSVLLRGDLVNKNFVPSMTVAWSGMMGNFFNACVNYTIMPNSYGNLGVGMAFVFNGIQLYLATDNIISAAQLLNAKNMHLDFGLLINWGKHKAPKKNAGSVSS